jgi:AraC-like DNA-binding protein
MALKEITTDLLRESGGADGFFPTSVPGLIVMRSSVQIRPQCMLFGPAFCLIVQGAKEMAVGETRAAFREGQSLVIASEVPTAVHITEATAERPYLGIGLQLDLADLREVMERLPQPPGAPGDGDFELLIDAISEPIENCIVRLVRAAGRPHALPILYPSIMRELAYWLLTGPNGDKIARQVSGSATSQRIARVVRLLRENFAQPFKIDQLAELANMSPSSFFQHFKSATAMTPLQFQKQIRLLEARRLLIASRLTVAEAANRVGYESASQFSREYSRMFRLPPARDASHPHGAAPSRRAG